MIQQYQVVLPSFSRGAYLITDHILKAISKMPSEGLLNIFIKHTSAALSLNENCDPDVRSDLALALDKLVPENCDYYTHTAEGPDDMPAHIKSSLIGASLTIPIQEGKLALGTWQGIYLLEFRQAYHQRKILMTIYS